MVKYISTVATFEKTIAEATNGKVVVIDYTAAWCGPCKMIAPHFEKLQVEADPSKILFFKVDIDGEEPADQVVNEDKGKSSQGKTLAENANITAMPTFRVYNSEGFVKEMKGAKPKDLELFVTSATLA